MKESVRSQKMWERLFHLTSLCCRVNLFPKCTSETRCMHARMQEVIDFVFVLFPTARYSQRNFLGRLRNPFDYQIYLDNTKEYLSKIFTPCRGAKSTELLLEQPFLLIYRLICIMIGFSFADERSSWQIYLDFRSVVCCAVKLTNPIGNTLSAKVKQS